MSLSESTSPPWGDAPPGDDNRDSDRAGRIAYQGAPGAFSHAACIDLRPWDQPVGFDTFEAALAAVASGDCDRALIPVENSTIGRVDPAAGLVEASNLVVMAEAWRPIRLTLMAPLGARLSDLRTAESHPVALDQCQIALQALGLASVPVFDTGGAARAVAEAGDPSRAAVAPARAAEVYGLSILRNDLQDKADNRTRFVLLGRQRG